MRDGGGGDRENRQPRERKNFNFDPNSNFRLYYLNDPQFYQVVIKKEEPPYEFKIHLFLDNHSEKDVSIRDITLIVMDKITDFKATQIKNFNHIGDQSKNDKIRFTFVIEDRE